MAHVAYWHHGHQDNVRHPRHCSTHFQLTMVAKVGSVLEHQSLAGRPSGSEFSRRTLASTRSGPEFQPSPRKLHTGTFSRDNASTPTPPLPLSSQALSQGVVTHFKDCQSVSLGGDAWPSVGGPLVGHWGQQTLGLTAASPPQCNLHHHHRFPPHPLSPLFDTLPRFHRLAPSL